MESGTKLSTRLKSKHGIVAWRAWYTGERVYDSASCRWEDLPAEGVLVVLLYEREPQHSRRMSGRTLYWLHHAPHGDIYACDDTADARIPEGAMVKEGRWTTEEEMVWAADEATKLQNEAPHGRE